ncbi:MAG: DsbA family protein [Neisseria sp.]|nr:DsbA family protein [Neisseria sp.]
MANIRYFFDPLCGWCYAVSPAIAKLAETHEVELLPTGLFSHSERKMTADFADYAWSNDQRIAQLTGQVFSESYRQNVLGGQGDFDSFPLVVALTAVRNVAPEQELAIFHRLQTARYVDGLDTAQMSVIADLLREILPQAVALLHDAAIVEQANNRIRHNAKIFAELGLQGVPKVLVQENDGWRVVPMEQLFG